MQLEGLPSLRIIKFMGIKTPEIKAALEVGTKDKNGMLRSQAGAVLLSPDKTRVGRSNRARYL